MEEQTNNTPVTEKQAPDTSSKGTVMQILQNVYPDRNFDDEETLFAQIYNDYSQYAAMIESTNLAKSAADAKAADAVNALAKSTEEIAKIKDGDNDADVDSAFELMKLIASNADQGVYTTEHIQLLLKALGYDKAVEKARAEGEVAGRNSRIEQLLATATPGDGIPAIGGSNAQVTAHRPRSIFDVARG